MADPVLVTGAASGIGRAVAELLPGAIAIDRADCDLADPRAVEALISRLPCRLGGVAHVAGLPGTHDPAAILQVNLLSPRRLSSALRGRLEPGSAIVNVASVAQFRSEVDPEPVLDLRDDDALRWLDLDGPATYDFTKRALVALTRRQARDGLAGGVRAVSVSPGPTETPILGDFRQSMGADRMDAAAAVVGRHGRPEDVAPVIAFLLSEQARWVNAVDVLVDGGLSGVR